MKSNICKLTKNGGGLALIQEEVEKCSLYNHLDKKQSLRLHLLAEELVGMLPELLKNCEGEFWIENQDRQFELHVTVTTSIYDNEERERIMSLSTSGKNAAAVGIMGKIRAAAEAMIIHLLNPDMAIVVSGYNSSPFGFMAMENYAYAWTLGEYMNNVRQRAENQKEWDELEKSIVANLADDVIVGIKGQQVEIIVKKIFSDTN